MLKRILTILVLVAVIAAVYTLAQSPQKAKETVDITKKTVDKKVLELFEVQNVNFYADSYNIAHIYGEVKNKSDTDAKEVLLEIRLIDKDGNLAKKIKVKVKNIPSGQIRTFDISFGTYNTAYKPEGKVLEVAY
ncbi:MAG: FxLYD domain-containing protein [Actinobacteria bacterium]|nr:FxLYD domain-containing protein [Actinomycetota bacterium]